MPIYFECYIFSFYLADKLYLFQIGQATGVKRTSWKMLSQCSLQHHVQDVHQHAEYQPWPKIWQHQYRHISSAECSSGSKQMFQCMLDHYWQQTWPTSSLFSSPYVTKVNIESVEEIPKAHGIMTDSALRGFCRTQNACHCDASQVLYQLWTIKFTKAWHIAASLSIAKREG